MKSNLTYFIAGILMMVMLSATAVQSGLITVKPQQPKSVYAIRFDSGDEKIESTIISMTKKGYIVHKLECSAYRCHLIMYKY